LYYHTGISVQFGVWEVLIAAQLGVWEVFILPHIGIREEIGCSAKAKKQNPILFS